MKSEYEPQLGDEVVYSTHYKRREGRIVGRTVELDPKFNVEIYEAISPKTEKKKLVVTNVPMTALRKKEQKKCPTQKKTASSTLTTVA